MTKKNNKPIRPFAQDFSGDGRTQQHFKQSCDVNNIVAHYTATGIDPYADRAAKQIFGFASSQTFEEALRATAEVNSAFASLPSDTRSEFANSPSAWLDHLSTLSVESDENTPPESPQEPPNTPELDSDTPNPDTPEQ